MTNQIKIWSFFALALVGLNACNSGSTGCQNGISGSVEGGAGKTIYLERYVNEHAVVTDSALVDEHDDFSIIPSPPLELNYYRLSFAPMNAVTILTDSTENIHIEAQAENLSNHPQVSGSEFTRDLFVLNEYLEPHRNFINEKSLLLKNAKSREEASQLKADILNSRKEIKKVCTKFINDYEGSPAALSALSGLNLKTDQGFYDKVLASTKSNFGHSYYYKIIAQQLANEKKKLAPSQGKATANTKYSIGMEAPNIVSNTPQGEPLELASLRGKVVLIDFWASWCGPCRRENPHVVDSYEKYHDDGFEVFSVSLDRSLDPWLKAIEKDGLIWPNHVCDFKGWKSDAAALYSIHSIPHTILIDREGKILGTHLRGGALTNQLKEIFGH